jgi:hypothetical protein
MILLFSIFVWDTLKYTGFWGEKEILRLDENLLHLFYTTNEIGGHQNIRYICVITVVPVVADQREVTS